MCHVRALQVFSSCLGYYFILFLEAVYWKSGKWATQVSPPFSAFTGRTVLLKHVWLIPWYKKIYESHRHSLILQPLFVPNFPRVLTWENSDFQEMKAKLNQKIRYMRDPSSIYGTLIAAAVRVRSSRLNVRIFDCCYLGM